MSTMTTMTRANVKALSQEAVEALQAVADKHGLSVRYDGGRFSDTNVTLKMVFACEAQGVSANGRPSIPADFAKLAPRYWLKATDYGQPFVSGGTTYTIEGIKPSRRTYPISGVGPQGGRYKFRADQVVRGLVRTSLSKAS